MAENDQCRSGFKTARSAFGLIGVFPRESMKTAQTTARTMGGGCTEPMPEERGVQQKMAQDLTDFHTKRYGHPSEFGYEDLVPLFQAENWDPEGLVKFFKDNGARFIMPVACHHDNFDMHDSFHPWNTVDMGPKRDSLKEWKEAAHKHGLKFGVSTHLYWSPRFFNNARQHQKEGTLAWKLF
jgi:alpha-L-fucosidase